MGIDTKSIVKNKDENLNEVEEKIFIKILPKNSRIKCQKIIKKKNKKKKGNLFQNCLNIKEATKCMAIRSCNICNTICHQPPALGCLNRIIHIVV